jgi:hypothetical protein
MCWVLVIYYLGLWKCALLIYIRGCLTYCQLGGLFLLFMSFMVSCLCGALGFMLVYFHLLFWFIVLLLLMFFLFVKSCGNFMLFCVMNSSILLLWTSLCNMSRVLLLSPLVTINWFRFIFLYYLWFRSWDSSLNWVVCRLSFNVVCLFMCFWILLTTNWCKYFNWYQLNTLWCLQNIEIKDNNR